jgi:predicted methyltransferase
MELEQILSEKLTNDKTAEAVESNYRGLIKVEGIERDIEQERYIKLNRLEQLMTPKKLEIITRTLFPGMETFTITCCPNCKVQIYRPGLSKHCDNCGQAIDWNGYQEQDADRG